ncbi:MAG TPA: OmpA family protein [Pseudomonadales bacterium]
MGRIPLYGMLAWALAWAGYAWSEGGPEKGQVTISGLGAYYEEPSDLELRRGDWGWGGGIGWAPHDRWSVEAMFFDFEPDVEVGGARGEGDMEYWTLQLVGKFADPDNWQPYFTVGGGRAKYEYDGLRGSVHDNLYNFGVGFFSNLTDRLVFRADVRGVYHHDADDIEPMAVTGLTFLLGGRSEPAAPRDSDGDGVPDDRDACPGTPSGTQVDSRGCELERDSDGDGVTDDDDQCPGTPSGVRVDRSGCPLDSDGDGVTDQDDECPGTPAGARVDERGCEVQLERPVSFDLTVTFGFDSDEITGVAFQEMLELLRFLREYPSTTAVVEGHTDSVGDETYNQQLSERRARAVVEALVNSGIDRDRLTARGYGESRPIASNDTEEGRAQNRRVTVVVSGTTTKPPSS